MSGRGLVWKKMTEKKVNLEECKSQTHTSFENHKNDSYINLIN